MEKLHPRAVWLFFLHYIGVYIVFLLVFGVGAVSSLISFIESRGRELSVPSSVLFAILAFLAVGIVIMVIAYIWSKLMYRFWKYELTEHAIKIEKGVIMKKYISIPYDRVQNVDIIRGLMARILGLSDLQIQTAGYSGGYSGRGRGMRTEGRLPGLAPDVAEQLRERLVHRAQGAKQGL